jgi:hypothetical protein
VVERYDFNKLYGGYDFGGYDYKTTGSGKGAAYKLLYTMSRSEMLDMAYSDPETFVAMVREELFDEVPKRSARDDYEIGDYESSLKYY